MTSHVSFETLDKDYLPSFVLIIAVFCNSESDLLASLSDHDHKRNIECMPLQNKPQSSSLSLNHCDIEIKFLRQLGMNTTFSNRMLFLSPKSLVISSYVLPSFATEDVPPISSIPKFGTFLSAPRTHNFRVLQA